jgi:hypothetical protein
VHPALDPANLRDLAGCFASARTQTTSPLVRAAYEQLQRQTDRQYAALTDPGARHPLTVVYTRETALYATNEELIDWVRATGVLEVTVAAVDRERIHPLLGCDIGGAYDRFRAVHDLVGHFATGYGFDQYGEYAAWLTQCACYHGMARWAAATELHGEISVLWTTQELGEHKAVLLDRELLSLS